MDESMTILFIWVESIGILAPIAFILLHIFRQFFFIPVAVISIAGGMLFGSVAGIIFSLIGLTLSSVLLYFMLRQWQGMSRKLSTIKKRWFGEYRHLTVSQVAVLRLIPFIHYHLLSFCLYEREKTFKNYVKASFLSNIPLAFFYTIFGEFISRFTPTMILIILFSLSILIYVLREKVMIIKWHEFFKASGSTS